MKKSTKAKTKKVSKVSSSTKRLKKYEEGGKEVQGLKRNSNFDSMPGSNMPLAPKGDAMTMNLKSEVVPANKQLKKIELPSGSPDFSGQGAYAVTPAKLDTPAKTEVTPKKVVTPKAKVLPGGFTSEAQKAAYTRDLKLKVKSGMTADELVKKGFGTKKGLTDLGVYDYEKGLNMKKEGQAKKKLGEDLKAKGTQNKKAGQDIKAKGSQVKSKGKNLAVKGRKEEAGSSINTYLTSSKKSGLPIEMTADGFAVTKKNVSKKGDKTIVVQSYDKKGNITKYAVKHVPADPNKKTTYREVKNGPGAKFSGFDNPGMRNIVSLSRFDKMFPGKTQDQIKKGLINKKDIFNALKIDENKKNTKKGLGGSRIAGSIMSEAALKVGQGIQSIKAIKDFFKKNPVKNLRKGGMLKITPTKPIKKTVTRKVSKK